MSWPHILIYVVVIGIGLPSAVRNPVAAALVGNWAIGEFSWMVSGDNLPLTIYFMADIAVIAVVCMKATLREGCRTYPTIREQIKCFGRAVSLWDRWLVASYILVAWPIYVLTISPWLKWWCLYWLIVAQFLMAGGEAVQSVLGSRKGRVMPNRPPGGLALVGAGDGT
jgi:hypothetical protein